MAHPNQMQFVKSIAQSLTENYRGMKVLEIGSHNVNGSVRGYFPNSEYVGVDLSEGSGVDLVAEGDKVDHKDGSYDITLSCVCFEHNPNWASTFMNMHRMTRDGGVVLFTCATTGRPEHGTTRTSPKSSPGTQALNWDYYKNLTQEDFEKIADFQKLFKSCFFLVNEQSNDLYFFGNKQGDQQFKITTDSLKQICSQDLETLQVWMTRRKEREKNIPRKLRKLFRKIRKPDFEPSTNPRIINEYLNQLSCY